MQAKRPPTRREWSAAVLAVALGALTLAGCVTREETARREGEKVRPEVARRCADQPAGAFGACVHEACKAACARHEADALKRACAAACTGVSECAGDSDCAAGLRCVAIAPRVRRCVAAGRETL